MTHRLTDEEFALATRTEAPPKLSRVPPGHWRCVFKPVVAQPAFPFAGRKSRCGCEWREGGVCLECTRHVSREIADEYGADFARKVRVVRYAGAEYFPGERP